MSSAADLRPSMAPPASPTTPSRPALLRPAVAWTAALSTAGVTGAAYAALQPRGPQASAGGVAVMVLGLLLGGLAGLLLHRRGGTLAVLAVHWAALELTRLPVDGPTVDAPHPQSTYGIIAMVTGRLVHGLFLVTAAGAGVLVGAAVARRLGWLRRGRRWLVARRAVAATYGLLVLALLTLVALPPTTEPIRGPSGETVPGSIAEIGSITVNGHETALMVRGHSTDNPVLLYLAGGPGGTDLGAMRLFGERLERDFVVATWDQRGAGASYPALDPTDTLTIESIVDDTIAVAEALARRFDERQVYLVANSWGTFVAVPAVQARPDLFAAYVGTGQMVSATETDRMFYEDSMAWARSTGDSTLVRQLRAQGPPPYDSLWDYEVALSHERDWNDYPRMPAYESQGEMPANLFVGEYSLLGKLRALGAFLDTFSVLYPQLREVDLRRSATSLDVPVFMVEGRHEARGRLGLAGEWFDALQAPVKQRFDFPRAGHRPHFERPALFAEVMADVLAATR